MSIEEIKKFLFDNGSMMDLKDLYSLADHVLIQIQCHKHAGPGWKGMRYDLQCLADEDFYGKIDWATREIK